MKGKTTDFNPNVDFCLFKGCITSRDVMAKHGYFAGTWSRVGQKGEQGQGGVTDLLNAFGLKLGL
jgi:hypothetical protein